MTMNRYGDFISATRAFCKNREEFKMRILKVLHSPLFASEIIEEQQVAVDISGLYNGGFSTYVPPENKMTRAQRIEHWIKHYKGE